MVSNAMLYALDLAPKAGDLVRPAHSLPPPQPLPGITNMRQQILTASQHILTRRTPPIILETTKSNTLPTNLIPLNLIRHRDDLPPARPRTTFSTPYTRQPPPIRLHKVRELLDKVEKGDHSAIEAPVHEHKSQRQVAGRPEIEFFAFGEPFAGGGVVRLVDGTCAAHGRWLVVFELVPCFPCHCAKE